MQLYPADYLADTGHLTTEEHGAYFLLILNYWQTGKALKVDRLANISRLSSDRWDSVKDSLSEFFSEEEGLWIHERIEVDLQEVQASINQKIAAGKASARQRAFKKQRESNDRSNGMVNGVPTESQLLDKIRLDNINTCFSYWQNRMGREKSKLTAKRKKSIQGRLVNFTVDDIKQAIEGCFNSEFHMGANSGKALHNDIELICLSDEKLEHFQSIGALGEPGEGCVV